MAITRLNNNSVTSVSALPNLASLPSGLGGKLIGSSRILYTAGTINITSQNTVVDTGVDHTYTASSTSNKLLHLVNCAWRQNGDGGYAGGITIYADDVAMSEINSGTALGEWHQDSSWNNMKGSSIHFTHNPSSTNAIKYSLYSKGDTFRLQNSSTMPIVWTILELGS